MLELFDTLWAYIILQPWGIYAMGLASVCYILTMLTPHLPVALTSKIPDWVMQIVNFLAAKSTMKLAAIKAEVTDNKGNPK